MIRRWKSRKDDANMAAEKDICYECHINLSRGPPKYLNDKVFDRSLPLQDCYAKAFLYPSHESDETEKKKEKSGKLTQTSWPSCTFSVLSEELFHTEYLKTALTFIILIGSWGLRLRFWRCWRPKGTSSVNWSYSSYPGWYVDGPGAANLVASSRVKALDVCWSFDWTGVKELHNRLQDFAVSHYESGVWSEPRNRKLRNTPLPCKWLWPPRLSPSLTAQRRHVISSARKARKAVEEITPAATN